MISGSLTQLLLPMLLPIDLLSRIRRIDEFNGTWKAAEKRAHERLSSLKHVATIESIGRQPVLKELH